MIIDEADKTIAQSILDEIWAIIELEHIVHRDQVRRMIANALTLDQRELI